MNILYLIGGLIFIFVLGYAYFLFVTARKEQGISKVFGQVLSGLIVLVLILLIILYKTGVAQSPQFMPQRPSTRIMQGMSGYVAGMMVEDEKTIDEFVKTLKANPELYEKFKEKLKSYNALNIFLWVN